MISGAGKTVIIFFLSLYSISGIAQQYNFRNYNVQDGLAHSQVSSILQDSKGYMWFSTYGGGLSRFDGKKFITYSEKEGLPNNIIRPILEDNKGNLWLGTMGAGICRFDGRSFTRLRDSTTKINEKIYTIIQSKTGTIWFGADNGLYSYDGNHVKHYTASDGFSEVPVMSVFEDSKGLIWVAAWEQGMYCYDGKTVKQFTEKDGLSYHTMMCTNEDAEGNLWFSGFKGVTKLTRRSDGGFVFSSSFSGYIDNGLIYMMMDDKKGNLWFATTEKGLVKYDKVKKTYTKISSQNGLPGSIALSIAKDREGNLWASIWGFGVALFQGEKFIHYTEKEGLGSDIISHVINDGKGGLLINSSNGIYSYSPETGIKLFDKQLEKFKASAMALDNKGNLWLGDANALYCFSKGKMKKYTNADGITSFPVTAIACDNDNVWSASWSGGLTCFNGKTFKNYSAEDGLSSPYIYTIIKNNRGEICIGTWDGGLNIFDGKTFKVYKKEQGLPGNNVISIIQGKKNMWIGTFGGGICEFDGKSFKTFTSKNGLSDDAVVALALDKSGNLYIASSKGLNKLNMAAYENAGVADFRFYGKEEGFTGIECTQNSAIRDQDGNLWFGTKKGLTKYQPEQDHINTEIPKTYISDVRLFFEKTDWTKLCDSVDPKRNIPEGLVLKYTENHLTFDFTGINTTVPEKVRYSYMLEGADKTWSPPADKAEVTYSGLPPGEYSFKVKACNNDGFWEKKSFAHFDFVIAPPFWKRTWFYMLCIVTLIGSSVVYTRWQTKKLARENKNLEQKVEERTAEVVKKKDELEFAYHEIEEKNRDITDSITYAKRIQYTLLANEELLKENIPDHFILFQPKDIVSGDFYWATKKENKFYLAVCDSTGHGVPGAFMSLLNISFLNEAISEKNISEPHEILNHVRERLICSVSRDGAQDGMDGVLLCMDKSNGRITYAAAHNRPVLIKDNELIQLKADKMPIGKGEKLNSFTLHEIEMSGSDTLYLYTDGYADQFGGLSGKKFKYKQLQQLLLANNTRAMSEQNEICLKTINDWKGKLEQVDDILVIGIRL